MARQAKPRSEIRSIYEPAPEEAAPISPEPETLESPPNLAEAVLTKPKKVITAADLKGGPMELPTGIVVEVQRATLMSLAAAGHIPNSLLPIAMKAAKKDDITVFDDYADLEPEEREAAQAQDKIDMENLMNAVVCALVKTPEIVATEEAETEDSVWVGRLSPADKTAIYYYAQAAQSWWNTFRIK